MRDGDRYVVNGRRYRMEATGRLFPIDGPGFHRLDRGAFKALGVYNQFGLSARAEAILDAQGMAVAARDQARIAWRAERGTV